jgi:hypothetical protein
LILWPKSFLARQAASRTTPATTAIQLGRRAVTTTLLGEASNEPSRNGNPYHDDAPDGESVTVVVDGDVKSNGRSENYGELRAQLDSERAKRLELERLAQRQLLQTQKSEIESGYREVYAARESKISEAARAAADYDHEKAARATADAAYLSSKLLVFEDGKNAAEQQLRQPFLFARDAP